MLTAGLSASGWWRRLKFQASHRLGLRKRFEFGVIALKPLVIFTHYDDSLWDLLKQFRQVELHCLITCWWTLTVEDQQEIAQRLGHWQRANPRHRIIHLVPTEEEAGVLRRLGLPFVVCSQNCLVDENVFKVLPGTAKPYRAIYDGRLSFFKRHELASRVEGLALITYQCALNEDKGYNRRTRELLAGSRWLNGPFSETPRPFESAEVAAHLNTARVGLILSEIEGANYASIQYLLCGLPVVTTRNRGGRDAFFDDACVIWADDTPEAVARAVSELIARNLDPETVRAATLRKVQAHRAVFLQTVRDIMIARGRPAGELPEWGDFFTNKLLRRHNTIQVIGLRLRVALGWVRS